MKLIKKVTKVVIKWFIVLIQPRKNNLALQDINTQSLNSEDPKRPQPNDPKKPKPIPPVPPRSNENKEI